MNTTTTVKTKTAADLMNRDVLTVRADATLEELAAFLEAHDIGGAPVVDDEGKAVGVVSVKDLALAAAEKSSLATDAGQQPGYFVHGWEDRLTRREFQHFQVADGNRTVGEVMTDQIWAVEEDTPVQEVARTMLQGHVHRLLVVRGEELVGIVSSSDLLALLAED